jgi:MFS family permease
MEAKEMNIWKRMITYDMEDHTVSFFHKYQRDLKYLTVLFLIGIGIFGQKLFFYALPSDDYMRFWGDDNTKMLITNSARWAQALLNDHIFVGKLQILPYLHGIIGIFSFILMGYLSAKFLRREKGLELVLVTLLIAATPMFAHNLYFSTNITAWVTLLLGVVGFIGLYRSGIWMKIVGAFFILVAIGNYQSIIQIILLLILFRLLLILAESEDGSLLKREMLYAIGVVVAVAGLYLLSNWINTLFLHHYHWHKVHRLAAATHPLTLPMLYERVLQLYQSRIPLNFFAKPFTVLSSLLFGMAVLGLIVRTAMQRVPVGIKVLRLLLVILLFASVPILIHLPLFLGVDIPIRAYFPAGWAIAGSLSVIFVVYRGFLKSFAAIAAIFLVIVNTYYITRFYDGCYRQTQADIRRANMIVQRIRLDPNYQKEPIGFHIIGTKAFNVKGWDVLYQQPFNSFWAKRKIFQYFTDLKFCYMSPKELKQISEYIVEKGELINAYPGKNSIIVYKNNAVLFLNSDKINIQIKKKRNIQKIPLKREPDIKAKFNLYVENNILFYYKKTCTDEDVRKKFFLRIYPEDPEHTVVNGRVINPFQTWDFMFNLYGDKQQDGSCIAVVELPTYKIARIRTGQFGGTGPDWDVTYRMHR